MAKLPAGIELRGNGYRIRIWQYGKIAYEETLLGTEKSSLARAIKRRGEIEARKKLGLPLFDGETGSRIFNDVAQRYLNSLDIDSSTVRGYFNQLSRYWEPHFGGWPITEITTAAIKDVLADMDLAQKTKKNTLIPLSGVFAYAGILPNPAAIKFGKRKKAEVERYTPAERDAVLSNLRGQDKLYFALLFATGLRPGEACALHWDDWDGDQLHITKQITKGKHKARTKTFIDRRVYVPTWVRPLLLAHPTRFERGYVFLNTEGNPYLQTRYLNKAWDKAHQTARVKLRNPYTCRHTRAAEMLSMGLSPADASNQLGHSVQVFLGTYSEFMIEYSGQQDFSRFEPSTSQKPPTGVMK